MDTSYRFCTPDQIAVAMRINLVSFLENHKALFMDLSNLAIAANTFLKVFSRSDFSSHDLAVFLSYVFKNNCRHDLKTELTKHILKETDGVKVSDGLDALGPVLVAMLVTSNRL